MEYIIKNINDISDDNINDIYYIINKEKRIKINKIINKKRRKLAIISEVILMELLNKNNLKYNRLIYKYNSNGKEYIDGIYYSKSYSFDCVIVGTSKNEIGLDIEKIRKVNKKTIYQFANEKEIEFINNSNNYYESFFKIFTLKESYIKMKGLNLSYIKNIDTYNLKDCDIIQFEKNGYYISICEKKE